MRGGRPVKPGPRLLPSSKVDGNEVRELARLGAERDTIVIALEIPRELLADPAFVHEFDQDIAFGTAWLEVDMLRERRSLVRDGKVSAMLAGMRNWKGWDRADRKKGDGSSNQQSALSDIEQVIKRVGRRR